MSTSDLIDPPVGVAGQIGRTAVPTARQRDLSVDALKGLAILGVMIYHLPNRRYSAVENKWIDVGSLIFMWAVPAFIFLSGFLHGRSTKREPFLQFIGNRARRLLVPYLCLGLAYAVIAQVLQKAHFIDPADPALRPLARKMMDVFTVSAFYGEQLYFYVLLFAVTSVFAAVISAVKPFEAMGAFVAMIGFVLLVWAYLQPAAAVSTGIHPYMFASGLFQYGAGYCYARSRRSTVWLYLAIAGLIVLVADERLFGFTQAMALPIPLLLMWLLDRVPIKPLWPLTWLLLIGQASGVIFAYHSPFLIRLLPVLLLKAHCRIAACAPLSYFLTLAACLILYRVLCRYESLRRFRL